MSLRSISPALRHPRRSYADAVRGHDDSLDIHPQEAFFEATTLGLDEYLPSLSPSPLLRAGERHTPELPGPIESLESTELPAARTRSPTSIEDPQEAPLPRQTEPEGSLFPGDFESHFQGHRQVLQGRQMPRLAAGDLNDLEESLFGEAVSNGFMLKRRSSQNLPPCRGRPRRHYLIYQCIRGGLHRDRVHPGARQRAATTRLTGCPYAFKVRLFTLDDGEQQEERYEVVGHTRDRGSDTHNHPPISAGQSHHMRRLPQAIVDEIRDKAASPMSPLEIYSSLTRRYPSECEILLVSDIYRARRRVRAEQLCGTGAAESLRRALQDGKYPDLLYRLDQREDDNTLHGMVWTTRSARTLVHRFGKVVTLDVTYNGNRHGHKLLHLCGFTATNQTFTIGIAAMPDENEATVSRYLRHLTELLGHVQPFVVVMDRAVALRNAVGAVWPTARIVLCQWHILENLRLAIAEAVAPYRRAAPKNAEAADRLTEAQIEASDVLMMTSGRVMTRPDWDKTKNKVKDDYQSLVVNALTETELENGLREWQRLWGRPRWLGMFDRVLEKGVRYVEDDGDGFVACRKNHFLHFDQRTTSRLEAQHASLRPYIGDRARRRVLAIDTLVDLSLSKFSTQYSEITAQMDYEMARRPALHSEHLTHAVRTLVSEYALNKLATQIGIARNIVLRAKGERFRPDGSRIPDTKPCTQQWRRSVGLPCAHEIAKVMNIHNGGSGVLNATQFDSQWWLSSSEYLSGLMETVDRGVASSSGVVRLDSDTLPVPGQRRLRDPVSAAARRGHTGSQRSPTQPRRSQTSTGRLLTQAEEADGLVNQPSPPCPACQRRHRPGTRPCRESLAASIAVAATQATVDNAENAETDPAADYQVPRPRQGRKRAREVDYSTIEARFATLRPSEVDVCPFCSKSHTRKWCNAMYEWRRWLAQQQSAQEPAAGSPEEGASDLEVSETLEQPASLALLDAARISVPSTPNRILRACTDSPTPSLDDIITNALAWSAAVRTQRLGSILHEDQPSRTPVWHDLEAPSVVPETQYEEEDLWAVSDSDSDSEGSEGSEVATTPCPATNGGVVITPSPWKRRRC